MKTNVKILGVIAAVAIGLLISSCKKEDNKDNDNIVPTHPQTSVTSASDNATAESIWGGIFKQADNAAHNAGNLKELSGCPTITIDNLSSYPITITIDFGTACTCQDGRIRSGIILAVLSAPYPDSASVLTITLQNYHEIINGTDYAVTGTETVTNLGLNTVGNHVYDVQVTNAIISSINGTISWTSHRQNEWIEGDNTLLNIWDDVYLVTGSADGTNQNGETFEINITTALRVEASCAYIVSGTLEILTDANPPIVVDYGNGTCDNIATATCYGYTATIYM
jgi:hypothetical protein